MRRIPTNKGTIMTYIETLQIIGQLSLAIATPAVLIWGIFATRENPTK